MTQPPIRTPAEHTFFIRSVLNRELERRMADSAKLENYPAVEEVRAALDSLAALRVESTAPNLPELQKRVAWVRQHWTVAHKPVMLALVNDLLAELERVV